MRPSDDRGKILNAAYSIESDGEGLALVLESGGGRPGKDAPQGRPRNSDYNAALVLLLSRLRDMDALLLDAMVDSKTTQKANVPESERRLLDVPIRLLDEPGTSEVFQKLKRGQRHIGRSSDGNRNKRIRLHLKVPGYTPADAALLEADLAAPSIVDLLPTMAYKPTSPTAAQHPPTTFEGALERIGLVPQRGEQANLRLLLMPPGSSLGTCALCGLDLPPRLLIAAHIKRRKDCTDEERRDLANIGMLTCLLGCDALYEEGLVSVATGGQLMISPSTAHGSALASHVQARLAGRATPWWNKKREKYYAWHRSAVYRAN
ncbi:hypothetical protein Skr01_35830 [Sphaerisporangium krabiense]|uniref:HNH endonuclease n=1 Tax=Sphaerisporangium krabiense TaxID=763782 RepID=A0A7W8Z374_9ACTN|nr:hypothetical protein [Sphaerisporangium krabiense]MBB5626576.1 hypothetical protein [Sphaerisporangium krabiense]GII63498.1 hypothetical protein Skr01_35830 [Sphaerisporangium krabiense]